MSKPFGTDEVAAQVSDQLDEAHDGDMCDAPPTVPSDMPLVTILYETHAGGEGSIGYESVPVPKRGVGQFHWVGFMTEGTPSDAYLRLCVSAIASSLRTHLGRVRQLGVRADYQVRLGAWYYSVCAEQAPDTCPARDAHAFILSTKCPACGADVC